MARLATVGFESQRLTSSTVTSGENSGTNNVISSGTVSMDTTTVRSGACAASMAQNAANYVEIASAPSVLDRGYYLRGYFRFTDATPSAAATIVVVRANSVDVVVVKLSTGGKLQLFDSNGAQVGSDHPTTLADNTWYRVELAFAIPTAGNTGSASVSVDGILGPAGLGTLDLNNSVSSGVIRLGNVAGGQAGVTTYLDDVALNDSAAGGTQTSYPGAGRILLAKPASDSSVGAGWEQPKTTGSDTTALYDSLDNMPPGGVAHSDADANNLKYIFNANSSVPSSYDANAQDYTTAGMEAGGRVRFCYVIDRHGSSGSATNDGQIKLVSNPADSGATSINFKAAGVAGTDPTNWQTKVGARVYDPSVTAGTQPVVRVTKSSATTDAAMVDLLGVLFEYDVPVERSAALAATTAVSASGTFFSTIERSASVDAAATVASAPQRECLRSAAIGATVAVESSGTFFSIIESSVALTASTAITTAPQRELLRQASLTASAEIAASGSLSSVYERAVALSATTSISTASVREVQRQASLTATGSIEAAGEFFAVLARAAALSAQSSVTAAAQRELLRSALLTAQGAVTVSGEVAGIVQRSAALTALATVSARPQRELQRAALVAALAGISVAGVVEVPTTVGHVTLAFSSPSSLRLNSANAVALAHRSRSELTTRGASSAELDEHPATDLELTLT